MAVIDSTCRTGVLPRQTGDPGVAAGPVTCAQFNQQHGPASTAYRAGYQVTYFGIQNNDFFSVHLATSTPNSQAGAPRS